MNQPTVKTSEGSTSWRKVIQLQTRELERSIIENRAYQAHNFA